MYDYVSQSSLRCEDHVTRKTRRKGERRPVYGVFLLRW